MIDSPVANIASSGLLRVQSSLKGDEANIDDLPTGLAVSRGPTFVQRTSLAAKAGVAWAGVHLPQFSLSRTEMKFTNTDGLGLKSGPIDFAVITPRYRSSPQETLGLPRWPLARPASAVTSEF